jgi:uncharacterized membrane protein
MLKFANFREKQHEIMVYVPLTVIAILIGGCFLFPSFFYDNFIWKYFWGPVVSDSLGYKVYFNGVESAEKFTWISEIFYALMILIVVYWLYQLIKKSKITLDSRFFLSLMPFILFGIIGRVLEDSNFFSEPLVYWFVTPLIYIQIVLWVLVFFVIGYFLQKYWKNKYVNPPNVLFIGGLILLIPFLYHLGRWFIGDQWSSTSGVRFDIFILIFGLVSLIVLGVYLFSRYFKKNENIRVFSEPLNLAMIMGHMVDGITSYISIYDPLNMGLPLYSEKHPASDILMQIWPPLFPIVKFVLVIIIIYVLDVLYKDELKNYRQFVNILKIVVFILGFAPGFRDLLRVMMGV